MISGQERSRSQIFGDFSQWVARPKRSFRAVVATAATLAGRRRISPEEMTNILREVYDRSVAPFFQPEWGTGSERLRRYNQLVDALSMRGLI